VTATDGDPGFDPRLQRVADDLRARTAASRTTVRGRRGDDPVALLAESRASGVASMRDGPRGPGIVAAPTYVELERTRTILVQADTRTDPIRPPASLLDTFRVYAQMLAPVLDDDGMVGTISVHQQDATRVWTPQDVEALAAAQRAVTTYLRGPDR
jgi:maleate isomerase